MKKAVAVLMTVLVIAGALIGCGGGAAGTYKFKSMSASGVSYTRETFQAFLDLAAGMGGEKLNVDDVMKFELTNDGKFTMDIYGEDEAEGTYTLSGDKITLTGPDGSSIDGTLKGNELTLTMEGETIVFEK